MGNIFRLLFLLGVIFLVSCHGERREYHELQWAQKECEEEGIVLTEPFRKDPNFFKFIECVYKKEKIVNSEGEVDRDRFYDYITLDMMKDTVKKLVEADCPSKAKGDNSEQVVVSLNNCVRDVIRAHNFAYTGTADPFERRDDEL